MSFLLPIKLDIKAAKDNKKDEAFIDRLALDKSRLQGICDTLTEIKSFNDPVGRVLASGTGLMA